jgi:DNA-binding transcriptional regulator/RsmH inhibitor MraZ
MSFLQITSRQISCTESMLQYSIFYLLPDIQPNTWLLYSKPAYLRLERKLRTLSAFADVSAQQRLNRLLVGHAIELLRDGNSITLPDEANFINPSSKICWKR